MNIRKHLVAEYRGKKHHIRERLREFRHLHKAADREIFSELCFCLLTPQAKAVRCDAAIRQLRDSGALFTGGGRRIRSKLRHVRFPNNKTSYILAARKFFKNGKGLDIKSRLEADNAPKTRDWLVKNIKGLGYKEASHFLRNIGLGGDMAILDVHVLRNLRKFGVIEKIPRSLSKKTYLETENQMRIFAKDAGIPLEELDLLFWSSQTGFIFK